MTEIVCCTFVILIASVVYNWMDFTALRHQNRLIMEQLEKINEKLSKITDDNQTES